MTYRPTNPDGSFMSIKDYAARASNRREKRAAKGRELWLHESQPQKTRPIAALSDRGALKAQIVRLLGLIDRKLHGDECRLGRYCPRFRRIGPHSGEVAYHVAAPQKRGDAARFYRPNIVWACQDANYGEKNNRDLYRHYHVALFGREVVESIERLALMKKHYTMAELRELRDALREELVSL